MWVQRKKNMDLDLGNVLDTQYFFCRGLLK